MKDLTASQLKKACEIAGNMAKQAKDIIVYQYGIIPVHIIESYAWYFTIRSAIDGSETHYVDMWTIFSEKSLS